MSKTEPKARSNSLLARQTQLEAEIKRLKALLPVRREGESDANYAFRVDQTNANFKARGNLNIKGDKNKVISRYQKGGHTAYSDQLKISQSKIPYQYFAVGKKFNTIQNTITKLETALSASRAQIGKRYLSQKEARQLGIKWNPILTNDSKMVNPDYNEYYDLDYAKPIVIDLPNGGTYTSHPSDPKYWDLKRGEKFTPHQLNPSVFNKNSKLTIQPDSSSAVETTVGANTSEIAPPPVDGSVVTPVPTEVKQKIRQKAPADLTWVDIDSRARGHTLTGPNYSGSVGGKNSVANNKARLLLNRARDINLAYGGTLDDAGKRKYLDSNKSEALKIAEA